MEVRIGNGRGIICEVIKDGILDSEKFKFASKPLCPQVSTFYASHHWFDILNSIASSQNTQSHSFSHNPPFQR